MPEIPEVQGLVEYLRSRLIEVRIIRATVANIAALKTYDPPIHALEGAAVTGVDRHGKFVDIHTDAGAHLIFHLAKAGWLRWYDKLPATVIRPGKTPIALRVGLSDGSGFDLTEAGTKKSLAVYVVRQASDVPGIARLGPDPLDASFDRDTDEILHTARMSPYALAASLTDDEVDRLFAAMGTTLSEAITEASGKPPADLKDAKRRGQPCPVCGDPVRSVFFADTSLEYCATCQTGGKVLADRRLSRLLK